MKNDPVETHLGLSVQSENWCVLSELNDSDLPIAVKSFDCEIIQFEHDLKCGHTALFFIGDNGQTALMVHLDKPVVKALGMLINSGHGGTMVIKDLNALFSAMFGSKKKSSGTQN